MKKYFVSAMRYSFTAAVLLLCILALFSCSESKVTFPEYTTSAVTADFCLELDGKPYRLTAELAPLGEASERPFEEILSGSLRIREPSALSEVKFCFEGNATYIRAGEVQIPASRETLGGICRILHCFSLKNESVTEVSTVSNTPNQTAVTYSDPYGDFTITYLDDLSIVSIEFVYREHAYRLTDLVISVGRS